ncbi:hypothetical protein ACVW19_006154 [Streptomyces sp. TE5632]
MGRRLTAPRSDFAAAIRDFAQRECGTLEQLAALTQNGREPHDPESYALLAGVRAAGSSVPLAAGAGSHPPNGPLLSAH